MKLHTALCALLLGLPGLACAIGPININTASERELDDLLEGIGPVRARSIISWRQIHGPFASVDDLAAVPGLSEKVVEKLRPLITVEDPIPTKIGGPAKAADAAAKGP